MLCFESLTFASVCERKCICFNVRLLIGLQKFSQGQMGSCKDANSCEKEKTFNNLNDPSDISLKTDTKEKMNKSSSAIYRSQRPVFDQPQFDIDFSVTGVRHKSAYERLNSMKSKCQCNAKCAKKTLLKHFPFIGIMKSYNVRTELINDIIGGLTVGVMHIPQGLPTYLMLSCFNLV